MKKPIRLREPLPVPLEPQAVEIRQPLPPIVRLVAESLALATQTVYRYQLGMD